MDLFGDLTSFYSMQEYSQMANSSRGADGNASQYSRQESPQRFSTSTMREALPSFREASSSRRSSRRDLVSSLQETTSSRPERSRTSSGGSRFSRLTRFLSGSSLSRSGQGESERTRSSFGSSSTSSATRRPKSNLASKRLVNLSYDQRVDSAIGALDMLAQASPNFRSTLSEVGKDVNVRVIPGMGVPAQVDTRSRTILVSDDSLYDPDRLVASMAFELGNLKRASEFDSLNRQARKGRIGSASEYAVARERLEYSSVQEQARNFQEARDALLAHGYGHNPTAWLASVSENGGVGPVFDSFDHYLGVQQEHGHAASYENAYHYLMSERK